MGTTWIWALHAENITECAASALLTLVILTSLRPCLAISKIVKSLLDVMFSVDLDIFERNSNVVLNYLVYGGSTCFLAFLSD